MLIKKGTSIELPIKASHYQPDFFPNPTKFEPERFLKENADQIIPYTYRPFGGNRTGKYTAQWVPVRWSASGPAKIDHVSGMTIYPIDHITGIVEEIDLISGI